MFFDYELPEELIAQYPVEPRDHSRLLVLERTTGKCHHQHFYDLPSWLEAGDLLVVNNTQVIPARLLGLRRNTGGQWEGLFLQELDSGDWEMLARTRGFPDLGEVFDVIPGSLALTLIGRTTDRHWIMRSNRPGSAHELLQSYGQIPLPPYIRKGTAEPSDLERYQTIYAHAAGSVAAPTAGLHFTPELLQKLDEKGINRAEVTLHVGLGTFASVKNEDPIQHRIHSEWCDVPASTVEAIERCRAEGGRVIAVGTTTTRTLESAARQQETLQLQPFRGPTSLYIHPPFPFQVIHGLVTNFHLPRTTLLLMVQALCGAAALKAAYSEAIAQKYRFYSYGDAMLII